MDLEFRDLVGGIHQRDVFLGADKGRMIAEEMHRDHGHAERERTHPVGDRGDRGRILVRIELSHHVVMQLSKPSRINCSGNSRPMKTRRLSRDSPSFHFRWWSPSNIMWTPWNT